MAMLIIRLKRIGRKNDPSFRIVVGEKIYSPKSGKHLAQLGSYNPQTKVAIIDEAKAKEYVANGAMLSDTIHNLFLAKGIIDGKKINVLPAFKAPEVKEEPKAAAPAPAAEAAPVEEAIVVEEVAPEPAPDAPADLPAQAGEPKAE